MTLEIVIGHLIISFTSSWSLVFQGSALQPPIYGIIDLCANLITVTWLSCEHHMTVTWCYMTYDCHLMLYDSWLSLDVIWLMWLSLDVIWLMWLSLDVTWLIWLSLDVTWLMWLTWCYMTHVTVTWCYMTHVTVTWRYMMCGTFLQVLWREII